MDPQKLGSDERRKEMGRRERGQEDEGLAVGQGWKDGEEEMARGGTGAEDAKEHELG